MQTTVTKKALLATVASLWLGLAATNAKAVAIKGGASCGTWVKESKVEGWPRLVNRSWLMGYLSGLVVESNRDVLRGTDAESLYLWVDNYCQSNPLKDIDDAGYILFQELAKQKRL